MKKLAYEILEKEIQKHLDQRKEFEAQVKEITRSVKGYNLDYLNERDDITSQNCDECGVELFTHYYHCLK